MVLLNLASEPRSAAVARRHVRDLPLDEETREVVSLLVTELVTNAVRHGSADDGASIEVDLAVVDDDLVRVNVVNHGPMFDPTPRERRAPDAEGGMGLHLVDKLAERWGVEDDGRTSVWLEVRRTV